MIVRIVPGIAIEHRIEDAVLAARIHDHLTTEGCPVLGHVNDRCLRSADALAIQVVGRELNEISAENANHRTIGSWAAANLPYLPALVLPVCEVSRNKVRLHYINLGIAFQESFE